MKTFIYAHYKPKGQVNKDGERGEIKMKSIYPLSQFKPRRPQRLDVVGHHQYGCGGVLHIFVVVAIVDTAKCKVTHHRELARWW